MLDTTSALPLSRPARLVKRLGCKWRLGSLLPLMLLAACGGSATGTPAGATRTPATSSHSTTVSTATTVPASTPSVVDGIYFRTEDNILVALNPRTGSRRWAVSLPNSSSDVVATNRVVYTYDSRDIVAVRASDGARLWSRAIRGKFTVANGIVYAFLDSSATGASASVSAINGLTGIPEWTLRTLSTGTILPLGSAVIVVSNAVTSTGATSQSTLNVLDASAGKLRWSGRFIDTGINDTMAYGSTLYVSLRTLSAAGVSNQVQAYRLADGVSTWKSENIPYYLRLVAVDHNRVYVETQSGLLALDVTNGRPAWNAHVPSLGQTILAGNVLYAPRFFNSEQAPGLVVIDAASGKQLWAQQFTSNPVNTPPIVANGIVFLSTTGFGAGGAGQLYALDTTSGSRLWAYQANLGCLAVSNGMLYTYDYSDSTAAIYAFKASKGLVQWKYKMNHHLGTIAMVAG